MNNHEPQMHEYYIHNQVYINYIMLFIHIFYYQYHIFNSILLLNILKMYISKDELFYYIELS